MKFAEQFANGFVLEKRTHFRGFFGGYFGKIWLFFGAFETQIGGYFG
jgi:hypothetical protein